MQKTQRRRRRVLGGRDKLDADGRIANSSATRSRRLAPSEAKSVSRKGNSYDHTNRVANARRRPRSSVVTCPLPWSILAFSGETGDTPGWKRLDEFLKARLQHLEPVLAGREWLAGTFSVADILMADVLRLVDRFDGLAGHPACRDYVAMDAEEHSARSQLQWEDTTMNKTTTLAGALVGLGVVSSAQAANSCEALCRISATRSSRRMVICFHPARSLRAFSNNGCKFDDVAHVPLSAKDQAVIAAIQARERLYGCDG